MNTIQEIFDKFKDQCWNEQEKFNLFMQWFDSIECERTIHLKGDFENFLRKRTFQKSPVTENEPTVNLTVKQISNRGAWLEFSKWAGISEFAKKDGLVLYDEVFKIPVSKAKEWNLI